MRYLALVILLGLSASLFGQNNSIALSQMKYAPAPNYAIITTTSGRQIYIEKDSFDIDTRLVAGWHSNDTLYLQINRVSGQLPGPIDTIAVYIPAGGGGGATYINAGSGISVTGAGTLANPFVITNTAPDQTVSLTGGTAIGVTGTYPNFTINNTAPDVTVAITGAGINAVSGTYPNFTITGTEVDGSVTNEGRLGVGAGGANTSTLTTNTSGSNAVTISGGTGISITESTSTNGGTITITNSSPDQAVSITGSTGITVGGSYPNFSLSVADQSATNELQNLSLSGQTLSISSGNNVTLPVIGITAGTGISTSTTGGNVTITNALPEATTARNVNATGEGVYRAEVGNELQFKKLIAGSNVTLTSADSTITIASSGGGVDTATFLQQDSILIYSVAGVEFGRDTIRTAGGGGSPCAIAAICPTYYDVTLAADGFGYVNTGMIDAGSLGGCDIASIEISDDNVNYGTYFLVDCTDLAGVTAYLKVTDQSSNTNTCSIAINVLDVNDPIIHCKDTVIYLDTTSITTITTAELYYVASASDNCAIDSVKIDSAGVYVDSIQLSVNGEYNFQLVAFDASLNLGYCTAHIRIGLNAGYIDFDTTYANNYAEGRMKWNVDENSVEIGLSANLSGTALMDDYWYVKNQTGSPIAAGQLVYASGTLGTSGRILVSPYIANGTIDAKYVLGVVAETIPDGADGYVITKGKLRGINTSAYADGTVLWASTANAGNLTDTVPQAPNFRLPVAFVVHSASNGILAVRVTTGSDLYEDHRVQVTTPLGDQLLKYNSTNQRWENWSPNFATADTSGYNNYFAISNDTLRIGDDNDTLFVKLPIVGVSAGTGISVSTVNGVATVTNSAPDQTVVLTAGAGITTSGTYPNFTITAVDTSATNELQTLSISNDTLSISGGNSVVLPPAVLKIRDVTVTTDTVVTADLGKLIRCNNAGAITLRINTNANQPLPIGAVISVEQVGAGVVTITPISGVTINPTARKTWGQYSVIQLIKVGTNTWNVVGGSS